MDNFNQQETNNPEPKVVVAEPKNSIPLKTRLKRLFSGKVSLFQSIIIISLLFFIAYYVVLNQYSDFMVEKILTDEELFQLDKKMQLMIAKEKLPTIGPYEPVSPRYVKSFGDIFSSLSHINRDLTDMYWDGQVGAFLFPPILSLKLVDECQGQPCDVAIFDRKWQGLCNDDGCLERIDNNLFYKNLPLDLPSKLAEKNILSLDIGGVGSDFYLGIVTGKTRDEQIFVYRFDGTNFDPIIDEKSEHNLLTDDRKGGRMAFGGAPNDYLIVYAGYFSKVLRVRGDKIEDLSKFLPIRLTSRGFYPQVFYSPSSYSYYICNSDLANPSLVKIWMDRDYNIIGSADLRQIMFKSSPDRLVCDYGSKGAHLDLHVLNNDVWQKWRFSDQGFKQDVVRQVVSQDIANSEFKVKGVYANSFNVVSELEGEDVYQLFFSNNNEDYLPALPDRWFALETSGNQLVWRMIFKTGDHPYYSPWFSDFRILNYELIPKEDS